MNIIKVTYKKRKTEKHPATLHHCMAICRCMLCVLFLIPGTGMSDVYASPEVSSEVPSGVSPVVPSTLQTDTLSILFRLDSISIDMGFADNAAHWQAFEDRFNRDFRGVNPALLRLDIYSGASPEGTAERNRWLGENRGQAVRRLVRQRLGDRLGEIVIHNEGARWEGFYDLVARSDEPWRDEVLRIIDMPATTDGYQRDHREWKLRRLQGGSVWPVLLEKYLAPLRSGATAVISWKMGVVGTGARDTIAVRDTTVIVHERPAVRDTIYIAMGPAGIVGFPGATDARQSSVNDSLFRERLRYPAWAIKTNLLLWGVVAPNIELEVPLGRKNRWSLELEYFAPWFIWSNNAHASQFHNFGIELRRYLGHRERHRWLQGWHIGLAVAAGYYDWEWKRSDGYQGEYINGYLNLGYQTRWGKHWAFDASIGLGAIFTKYRHYYGSSTYPAGNEEPWDRHLMYHDSDRLIWPGACHASLQLAYMFNAWPFHTKSKKLNE